MVFFDFFKKHDINAGMQEYKATAGGVLLDVRTPEEFREVSSSEVRKMLLQDPVPENELRRTVPEEILPMLLSAAKGGNTP